MKELKYCDECNQMTNHCDYKLKEWVCLKCGKVTKRLGKRKNDC